MINPNPNEDNEDLGAPPATSFRLWMKHLNSRHGNIPEWPWLMRELLAAEFTRQRAVGFAYARDVFKDRDQEDPTLAISPEKRQVRDLYHQCLRKTAGLFTIDDTPYWLLGYEWPNQGSEKGRRADLVGLNLDGGLVVFECKLDDNSYGPFAAVLEGLDYLACLTSTLNAEKIIQGFTKWSQKSEKTIPKAFHKVKPDFSRQHQVIVLATHGYFDLYRKRSGRGLGWSSFAELNERNDSDPVLVRFAQTDYQSPNGIWITE